MSQQTCPCQWCGKPTAMLGTKECDSCHELHVRIRLNPEMAKLMLDTQPDVPDGWAPVPMEPTPAMMVALSGESDPYLMGGFKADWLRLLAVAPQPPQAQQGSVTR